MSPLEKQTTSTTSNTNRRSNKPIMEKKRRARINNCLNELKNLLLEAMKKDPTRHSKLEKADILEMTVRHLQQLRQRQVALTVATDPEVTTKYKAGFHECADEVQRYVRRLDGMDTTVKQRLFDHLSKCAQGLHSSPKSPTPPAGIYLNNRVLLNVTPSRLPSGDLALLLPREWTTTSTTKNALSSNAEGGLLMTTTPDHFPPLTINCASASSPPMSRSCTLNDNSPTTSDYSSSESSASHVSHLENRHHTVTKLNSDVRRHQVDVRPPALSYCEVSRSRWSAEEDDEEMSLPVDLSSSKDGDRMWRPW